MQKEVSRMVLISILFCLFLASTEAFGDAPSFLEREQTLVASDEPMQILSCGPFTGYSQPADTLNINSAYTSDGGSPYQATEDIVDAAGAISALPQPFISGVRWWGVSIKMQEGGEVWIIEYCPEDDTAYTPFNFYFYADSGGSPGALLDSRMGVVPDSIVDTGVGFVSDSNIFEYSATFAQVSSQNVRWIGIERQLGQDAADGNWCWFLWSNETLEGTYDDAAYQFDEGAIGVSIPYDLTMCLSLEGGGVIPTLSAYGMLALIILIAGVATYRIRRRYVKN